MILEILSRHSRFWCPGLERRNDLKKKTLRFGKGFRVALGNSRSQAAEMVLEPGDSEGSEKNNHRGADQWLYVVEGKGVAIFRTKRVPLKAGTLVLIEKGNIHEIRNTGETLLKTLNFYVPPAYDNDGEPLARGKPK